MKTANDISVDDIKKAFRCHPDYGQIINIRLNRVTGSDHNSGYLKLGLNGKMLLAHRVAFVLYYGRWPTDQIDHINGDKHDNRKCNLREASNSQNHMNDDMRSHNTSGFKGVSWDNKRKKWQANIRANNKQHNLGRYEDIIDAKNAYNKAALELHGEFCNIQL